MTTKPKWKDVYKILMKLPELDRVKLVVWLVAVAGDKIMQTDFYTKFCVDHAHLIMCKGIGKKAQDWLLKD